MRVPARYERLLGNTIAREGALFARADCLEATWAAVDPILERHHPVLTYECGSWGPKAAEALFVADGSWHNPYRATP